MDELNELFEQLQYNEEISRRFFEVEVSILSILNFKDLFERLLTEIREKFQIPHVWITLVEDNDIAHHIRRLAASEVVSKRLNLISRSAFQVLVGTTGKPLLVNREMSPFYRLFPANEKYLVRSLAIVPIAHRGEIIGSLNHGDPSESRYSPGMDTSLLERLGIKVSLCLSNVIAHERLRVAAFKDPLTGLLNRRVMESALDREYHRAVRYETRLSVVFMDIDGFKAINDQHGHDTGDLLLRGFAEQLMGITRQCDIVSRYAGDEFVLILPATAPGEAEIMMDRLKQFFHDHPVEVDGRSIGVSFSYGIAAMDSSVGSPHSLLKRADKRLYQAKQGAG